MASIGAALLVLLSGAWGQKSARETSPETMTKMVVRMMGPGIQPGSFAALPKTIYRAGEQRARIEDPPDARQKMQKLTVIAEPDAYSANLIENKGAHAIDGGGPNNLHLPIVLPLDPRHKLGKLDGIEFGTEYDFFKGAGSEREAGPIINAKPTDAFRMKTGGGTATLVVRAGTEIPITLSWETSEGTYKYEYITYEDLPFDPSLFVKPKGIQFKEIPPDPEASAPGAN